MLLGWDFVFNNTVATVVFQEMYDQHCLHVKHI